MSQLVLEEGRAAAAAAAAARNNHGSLFLSGERGDPCALVLLSECPRYRSFLSPNKRLPRPLLAFDNGPP